MRPSFRIALAALLAVVPASAIPAQAPPAAKPAAPAAKAATPARPASLDQVLATVNGEKITKAEVINYLSHLEQVPGEEKTQYKYAVEMLVNTTLLNQYLKAKKFEVGDKQIDSEFNNYAAELKQKQGRDIATALAESNVSAAELRSRMAQALRWKSFMMQHSSDEELLKYIERNKDLFNKSQVRVSHILAAVEPDATPADKQKAKQKLADLKKQIDAGKITFADAADKYSEDEDLVKEKSGGDLQFIGRDGPFLESFNAAAFALKKGQVSDPVETDYGYHLIQVTDRKEGAAIDPKKLLAQFKEEILNKYGMELQAQIVADQKKAAKVDIQPMPTDIFPPPLVISTPEAGTPKADTPKAPAPKADAPKAATPRR